MPKSALQIESGQELLRFDLGTVVIAHTSYTVLTGYEGTGRCFWCGDELKGKLKRYCYGHMKEYYRHFEWGSAREWCIERQDGNCLNCGTPHGSSLEVHHIVPLEGRERYFSAYNLPWNLMGFCHDCHQAVHEVMAHYDHRGIRKVWLPPARKPEWQRQVELGQIPLWPELVPA